MDYVEFTADIVEITMGNVGYKEGTNWIEVGNGGDKVGNVEITSVLRKVAVG